MIHGSQGRYNLQAAAAHISKDADGCHCFPIVTVDVDPVCFRKSPAPYTCPPAEYAFRSKFCSIMVSAKVDKSCVVIQYVYAVGATLPSSGIGKSWFRTLRGSFVFLYSSPLFLKLPIFSFFFASTEITGSPFSRKSAALLFMNSNCSFLSGWGSPTWSIFWFACLLYPSFSRMLLTERKLMSI